MAGAGQRDRLIVIERAETTENAFGEPVEHWRPLTKAWAAVRFSKGSERREAAQLNASAPATFIILDNPVTRTISVKDRILFDGGIWNIVSNIPGRQRNAEREIEAVRDLQ